jgi:hypothetical protein
LGIRLPFSQTDAAASDLGGVRVILNIAASWERGEDDAANIEWARAAWRDMRRFSTGGTYINFQTEDEGDERVHNAYGANYDRLVEVKTAWDPTNFFRVNKNIVPRVAGEASDTRGSIMAIAVADAAG